MEAFTPPILSVIILHLCKCGGSIRASPRDPLSPLFPCSKWSQDKTRSWTCSFTLLCPSLVYIHTKKREKKVFISCGFSSHFLEWMNEPACVCVVFQLGAPPTHPPTPHHFNPKLRKYRQPGHRNSVTSYWAPKSVENPAVEILFSVNLKLWITQAKQFRQEGHSKVKRGNCQERKRKKNRLSERVK